MKKIRLLILVFAAAVVMAPPAARAQFFMFENPLVGEQTPEFRLPTLKGGERTLSEARGGKNSILFFWATWCPHCRTQLKELNDQQAALSAKGINVILVDLGEDARTVQAFLDKQGVTMDAFLDESSDIAGTYKVVGVPTFYFIDAQGVVQAVEHSIPKNYEELFSG